jgi:hypothetical protein
VVAAEEGLEHWIWVDSSEDHRVTADTSVNCCPLRVRVNDWPGVPLVGLILLIVGDAAPIVNALIRDMDCPSGLMTWIFVGPVFRLARLIVHVICVEDTETPDAAIGWSPAWTRFTVAPFWKLLPVIVRETLVPVAPVVGDTAVTIGPLPESVVGTVVNVGVA